jgi:hypothetical protein
MSLIRKPLPPKIYEKWAKMSPGALDVMNIHEVYAWICMPAPPSGRLACRSTGTWYLVNTGRIRKVWCLITDLRTAGRGKFKFGEQVGETDYSTVHAGSDPNYLGDVSNHRRENGWSCRVARHAATAAYELPHAGTV